MGTTHMDDYVKSQFPNHWNNYTKRIYKIPNSKNENEIIQSNQNKKIYF